MIPVVFCIYFFKSAIWYSENPISSKWSIVFEASRNLITTFSLFIPGIKLILASTFFWTQFLSDASNENLPSCGKYSIFILTPEINLIFCIYFQNSWWENKTKLCKTPSSLIFIWIPSSSDWKWRSEAQLWNANLIISLIKSHGSLSSLCSKNSWIRSIADFHSAFCCAKCFCAICSAWFCICEYRSIAKSNPSTVV